MTGKSIFISHIAMLNQGFFYKEFILVNFFIYKGLVEFSIPSNAILQIST